MKKIILVTIVAVIGWYITQLYQQHRLPFVQDWITQYESKPMTKCITEDGSVIYGTVPPDTKCEKVEPVNGSLTVVPDITSYETPDFKCDGRTYCSQMTSCEEAKYFLKHCPGVKMDGDNDGVPCESQWCN